MCQSSDGSQDPFDRRTMDYHCLTCGVIFKLNPDRAYLVFPFHCETCEVKIADDLAKAFDEMEFFKP